MIVMTISLYDSVQFTIYIPIDWSRNGTPGTTDLFSLESLLVARQLSTTKYLVQSLLVILVGYTLDCLTMNCATE